MVTPGSVLERVSGCGPGRVPPVTLNDGLSKTMLSHAGKSEFVFPGDGTVKNFHGPVPLG